MSQQISYPRQAARTQRFTLGTPRSFALAPDGGRVAFLRSAPGPDAGRDRVTCLWVLDTETSTERLVADPRALLASEQERLSDTERARRERSREGAAGIVSYATDAGLRRAVFALSGRLYLADLTAAADGPAQAAPPVGPLPTATPVIDPRLDPTGRRIAYAAAGGLRVIDIDTDGGGTGGTDRALVEPDEPDVTWGLAEFIAAEEMSRYRGHWWAPDGESLLVARVDERPVRRWHIADPANPDRDARAVAYPAAGTPNAEVGLFRVGLDSSVTALRWDATAFPYLVSVHWSKGGPPLLTVQSRDQREMRILTADPVTGATDMRHTERDPDWVEIVGGVPAWLPGGRLLHVGDRDGARRLLIDDQPVTPPTIHVRSVAGVAGGHVLVTGSTDDPAEIHLWRVSDGRCDRLTDTAGVHTGAMAAGNGSAPDDMTLVVMSRSLAEFGTRTVVRRGGRTLTLAAHADTPVLDPNVTLLRAGERGLRAALVLPTGYRPEAGRLPVLLDPYGGPHSQRVLAARNAYLEPQWWAEQGFAVLVVDGRGTPGRGPAWEREIAFDFAGVTLTDQVDALHAVAAEHPYLDTDRVAIRGWSYGGYLAALAVLRRPDTFHAAVAGAPVTDWRLYDTHYTERYLGDPNERPEIYAANGLIDDAAKLERPLLLVHGLADDNVVAAHTLRLSAALLAAGRAHQVLPLSGVTHMTPQEVVAENLLLLQAGFLKSTLGI